MESVRESLGVCVPAGCRMELTRESHSGDQAPLSCVHDLCNGDIVTLVILQDRSGQGGPDGDADFACVHGTVSDGTGAEDELSRVQKRAAPLVLEPQSPPQLAMTPSSSWPAREDGGEQQDTMGTEEAAMREAVDKLVAAPARLPTPLDSLGLPLLPQQRESSSPHATITSVRGQVYPVSTAGLLPDDGQESCDVEPSLGLSLGGSLSSRSSAGATNAATPPLQAPSHPSSLQHGLLIAASPPRENNGPAPVLAPLAPSSPDPSSVCAPPNPPPAADGCAPLGADEAAIAELVGMGFDRGHVIGALRVCNRGESWKEAAISLLLEPQISAAEVATVEDPEAGLKRYKAAEPSGG